MPTRPPSPDPTGTADTGSSSPFAGIGAGFDFFQDWLKAAGSALPHLQGQSGASGMSAWTLPTLDPAELDKRIQDLKTVQFWLEQNARMIAMTIQGLEVQKMTLSTLQGMNVSMDSLREALKARTTRPAPPEADDAADAAPESSQAQAETPAQPELINPMQWWDTLTQQFTHLASQTAQTAQSVSESVGSSMNDLLAQTQAQAAAATRQAQSSSASGDTAKTAVPRRPLARKTAPKA